VKLIDFGLAKTKQSTVQSQVGVIKGKLNYVAPEYLSGKLDARCDLWALGVVLYELLTNNRLFDAPEQGTILERVRSMPIPSPSRSNPEVTADVDHIVLTALARDPTKRWQRAADMRAALEKTASSRITQQQLVAWVEWAFSQKQPAVREDSAVSALHEIVSSVVEVVGELPAISEAMEERRRESVALMPALGTAMLERRTSGRWIWFAFALIALLGAAGFLAHTLGAF
jgi:serine/threonine protein kinase